MCLDIMDIQMRSKDYVSKKTNRLAIYNGERERERDGLVLDVYLLRF